ncbi:MAG: extracellular solute-binding protein [Chloroflexi bacterium]|nr:extracellular solute-binding protein [Chloroflexota bacterium]
MKHKNRSRLVTLLLVLCVLLFTACSTGGAEVVAPTVDTAALDAAQAAAADAQATAEAAQAALEAAADGDEAARATLEAELAAAQAALGEAESAVSEAEAAAAAAADAQATAEAELAAIPVDIELWAQATVTEAGPPPGDWIAYQIIKDELNINLTYTIIPTGGDGEAKLNAAAAPNDLPDLFQLVSTSNDVRGALLRMVDLGLVAPVDDLMPLMPQRTELHYNDPLALDLVTFDGQQYGLPEPPPLPKREGLVIRKDWLDALGLAAPTTIEEVYEIAVAFTEQDPDGNGQNDTYGIGGFINGQGIGNRFDWILGAYGVPGVWNFADGTLNVRNDQYPEALAYMTSLVDAG